MDKLTKLCTGCNRNLSFTEFVMSFSEPDGISELCNYCDKLRLAKEKQIAREKLKEAGQKYKNEMMQKDSDRKEQYYKKIKELIEGRGGVCISPLEAYETAFSKLNAMCQDKHIFEVTLNNLNGGRWCPRCRIRITEKICIQVMEHIFGVQFPKARPDWLKVEETGKNLELDGFNEELGVAIEVQGEQHYKEIAFFHRSKQDFEKRQKYDQFKRDKCIEKEIILIEVPYSIEQNKLYDYIVGKCQEHDLDIDTETPFNINVCFKAISILEKILKLIKKRGGKLITEEDKVNMIDKFMIECDKSHQWETTYKNLRRNLWCPTCGLEMDDDTKKKISVGMKKFLATDKGKASKALSFAKRSETLAKQKQDIRANITEKICGYSECSKAGELQPISNFNKKSAAKDGYQTYCKNCILKIKKNRKADK
jgi:hypothetical protein